MELPSQPTALSVQITLFPPPFAQRITPLIDAPTTDRALSLFEQGKFIESIEICNRVLREAPSDIDFLAFTIGALALEYLGDWQNCVNATTEALLRNPENFLAWTIRSNALRMQNKLGPSLEAAEFAVYHSPENSDAHHTRALTLQRLGREEEAKMLLNEATEAIDQKLGYLHKKRRFLLYQRSNLKRSSSRKIYDSYFI